jgi:hypothetical protein
MCEMRLQDDVLGRDVFHSGAARENLGRSLACLPEVLLERARYLKGGDGEARPPVAGSHFLLG